MNWLFPSAIAIAGAAAVVAVILHLISRRRPLAEPFPTARFIPRRGMQASAMSMSLSDRWLLLLRVAAVLLLGAGAAAPMFAEHGQVRRVIVVDRSRAVASEAEVRDSLRALMQSADAVVVFDSAATAVTRADGDMLAPTGARGSLSTGIAAAMREATVLSAHADSVDMVLVTPAAAEEMDAATPVLREAWPGRIRVVLVRAAAAEVVPPRMQWASNENDGVLAGLSLLARHGGEPWIRVVRGLPTGADSTWARDSGHLLVHWPTNDSTARWTPRAPIDAIGGVASFNAAVVARFPRLWTLAGRPIAWWADGEPAAVERATGDGCIRDIGILIDPASDVTLQAPFRRFAEDLLVPCGGRRRPERISAKQYTMLVGRPGLAPAPVLRRRDASISTWTPWLLVVGALMLTVELALRRAGRRAI